MNENCVSMSNMDARVARHFNFISVFNLFTVLVFGI